MSKGVADRVAGNLGKNPLNLSQAEWEEVALSGKGPYVPLVRNETEFHAFTPGATGKIVDGVARIDAAVGLMEGTIINFHAKNPALFMKKFGHPPDPIEGSRYGNTRGEFLANLQKVPEQERRGRDADYVLVASGALRPWAKQLSDHIQNLETKDVSNRKAAELDVRDVVGGRPLLKKVIDDNWRKAVVSGKMTRYEHERRRAKYLR